MATEEPRTVQADAAAALAALRAREREILLAYSLGLATQEVASVFFLSPHTVRTHVKNALKRLGLSRRRDAVDLFAAAGDDIYVRLTAHRISEPVRRWLGEGDTPETLAALVAQKRAE